jgi:hypothetical protein
MSEPRAFAGAIDGRSWPATEAEMNKLAIAIGGAALGAGVMYLLDPGHGRARRARLGDAAAHAAHRARAAADTTARDARHRLYGLGARALGQLAAANAPTDDVLIARVRARLGRLVSHPGAIDVTAAGGAVTLAGPVFDVEIDRLLAGVADVAGVTAVENRLEPHADAAHVSALQGEGPRAPAEAPARRWMPTARMVAGLTGIALVALARRGDAAGHV